MANIAKLIKFLITLASLVASIEALVKLAKFAWNLVLQLKKVFKFAPGKFSPLKGFRIAPPAWNL